MKWGIFRSEIDPNEELADRLAAARSPYADAWKEFDKLEKNAKNHGIGRWIHFISTFFLPLLGGGTFGFAEFKGHRAYVAAGIIGLAVLALLKMRYDRSKFAEWPCPRCHAVWPGTRTEKDPACKVCGLRLHQMSP